MKTELLTPESPVTMITASLHDLVDTLANSLQPAASRNKSLIINDVPVNITAERNEHLLSSVLAGLMNEVITHTESSCIRITAKTFRNVVLLHVKNDGSLNYDSISHNLSAMQTQAEKLDGFIGFTSYRNKITTIAFSFTNIQEAA
ncbi:MAG: hypothetical protein WDO71_16085 [Bacteroidota bacterium]